MSAWSFFVDRGGTFTDIVARTPAGHLVTHKLLSEAPERYADAAVAGIRQVLESHGALPTDAPLSAELVREVRMGTTVATNALLERRGEPTALAITRGFGDALRIAYQNRPRIFDRHIVLPGLLYSAVVELEERVGPRGDVLVPLDEEHARGALERLLAAGFRSLAVVLVHGYRHPTHEKAVERLARSVGFTQVSASHAVSPLMKLVSRGDTTVVDAYVSPILARYVAQVRAELPGIDLSFMQSNGGLAAAEQFRGKDSVLSGPAGGIVGMVRSAVAAGFHKLIGFDMGGTSTDVSHFAGKDPRDLERSFETTVAGVRMCVPMLSIHTVAAGGGSRLHFDGSRLTVGPGSTGSNPGPVCYRRGGDPSVTDCNVFLGKIHPEFFPKVFGERGDEPVDVAGARRAFEEFSERLAAAGAARSPEDIAEGFIQVTVSNMVRAIQQISIARGHDVTDYALAVFGGAGGQHACLVADALGMSRVVAHPLAGVLSAYGIGLAEHTVIRERAVEATLTDGAVATLIATLDALAAEVTTALVAQGIAANRVAVSRYVHLRYEGTDTSIPVDSGEPGAMRAAFEALYRRRFALSMPDRALVAGSVSVHGVGRGDELARSGGPRAERSGPLRPTVTTRFFSGGAWLEAPLYERDRTAPGDVIEGPAIVVERNQTTVVEPGWAAEVRPDDLLVLSRVHARPTRGYALTPPDPVLLEVFNNRFMGIAERMGQRLQNTAQSVNIKERLDFSCAVFDARGHLIANAPHMPVHLGSMGDSVRAVMKKKQGTMRPGDVYVLNAPYDGGTHLPDVTVVTPVFERRGGSIEFFVGSRGHHADIGGISPGSMPADSRTVLEEGVLIDPCDMVSGGAYREAELRALLGSGAWPARSIEQNLADLRAQAAANALGEEELRRLVDEYGRDVVHAYMGHVQDHAEEAVRRVITALGDGEYEYRIDPVPGCPEGPVIRVAVRVDRERRSATVDFTGTSPELPNNFNAPRSITTAAVLYVFRTLVDADIPLNEGCLRPLEIIVPEGSMLAPRYPAAVVAGNVETSQCVTQALYGALGLMSESQGSMNNFTFGDATRQYYETIAGGSAAGVHRDGRGVVTGGFDGTDVVQTHMTNSRLTDPEVLEWRFPVLVEEFRARRGSGGEGRFRGGEGAVRRVRFLEPMTASILSNNRVRAPRGAAGGGDGAPGVNRIERADGSREELPSCCRAEMRPGDVFVIETPGAGGFGSRSDLDEPVVENPHE